MKIDEIINILKDPSVLFIFFGVIPFFIGLRFFAHEFWGTELDGKKPPF